MPSRSYEQLCALARALELVGDRWTILVIRHLTHGSRRFGELRAGLPGVSTALLSDRLRRMAADGLVDEVDGAYRLTEFGRGVEPAMWELMRWGAGLLHDPDRRDETAHADWVVFPLRWLLSRHPVEAPLLLHVDAPPRAPVLVRLTPEDAELIGEVAADDDRADARLGAVAVPVLADVLSGRRDATEALGSGAVTITDDGGWFVAALATAHDTPSRAVRAGRVPPPGR